LGFAFDALRVRCEDVEYQRCSVNDLYADLVFEIAQLRKSQLAVTDHRIRPGGNHNVSQLRDLAASDVGRRVWSVAALDQTFENL
jgi:hypothetical protein